MGRRTRVMAPSRAVLNTKERAIRAILAVRIGLFKHISEACKNFGCELNSYYYHAKGSAGTMSLESSNLATIKESVKAAAPAAVAAVAALVEFNYLLCGQAPILSVAALRAIKSRLDSGTGYMNKGFGFEDYSTVMGWAGKEAADGPLVCRGAALVVKVKCSLQLHPNTVGKAKHRLLAAWEQARKGASYPGAGTAAADSAKAAPPHQRGSTTQYPHRGAVNITAWVHGMCTHKLPVFKCMLMGVANAQIKGNKWESNWPDCVTDNWYYRYLCDFNLSTGTSRPLEISRSKWTTLANMKIHYDVVVEVLIRLNIAVRNQNFVQGAAGRKGGGDLHCQTRAPLHLGQDKGSA